MQQIIIHPVQWHHVVRKARLTLVEGLKTSRQILKYCTLISTGRIGMVIKEDMKKYSQWSIAISVQNIQLFCLGRDVLMPGVWTVMPCPLNMICVFAKLWSNKGNFSNGKSFSIIKSDFVAYKWVSDPFTVTCLISYDKNNVKKNESSQGLYLWKLFAYNICSVSVSLFKMVACRPLPKSVMTSHQLHHKEHVTMNKNRN